MTDLLLVGSTNVGKSTLFNLLVEKKQALVADIHGLTKDWEEGAFFLHGRRIAVIDTPGLEHQNLSRQLPDPWHFLIAESRLICLVTDGQQGLTSIDQEISQYLRQYGKTYVVIVNKMDLATSRNNFTDFFVLAGDQTLPLVAKRKQERAEICQALSRYFPASDGEKTDQHKTHNTNTNNLIKLVVLGKPNSGKSSLINHLLGYDRLAVSSVAGTTRNAVTVDYSCDDQAFALTDTAGIRRRQKIKSDMEKVTTQQSWLMVRQTAEVVLVLVDVAERLTKQDWTLLHQTLDMGKPVLVCFTKIDLLTKEHQRELELIKHMKSFRVAFISSVTGEGVQNMLQQVRLIRDAWSTPIATTRLNKWLQDCTSRLSPPYVSGKRLKLKYIVQISTSMPRFLIFGNDQIPGNYFTYLQGSLRKEFDLWSVPFDIECRIGAQGSDKPNLKPKRTR